MWWEQTSKAEQTDTDDHMVTLLPHFPLQRHTSLPHLHSSFSTILPQAESKYFMPGANQAAIIPKEQKGIEKGALHPLPVFIPVHYIWRKFSTCHHHYSNFTNFASCLIPHDWTEFCSETFPHISVLVPWNKNSLWPPCVSWCVPFW